MILNGSGPAAAEAAAAEDDFWQLCPITQASWQRYLDSQMLVIIARLLLLLMHYHLVAIYSCPHDHRSGELLDTLNVGTHPVVCLQERMRDPVLAADGQSYERTAIEAWLAAGRDASPVTGAPLAHSNLIPIHAPRSLLAVT